MNALTVLILIGLLWGIKEFVYGTILWYQRRKIRHDLRVETTQRHFAVARNELMRLALTGEVDVNSASFKRFYFLNTTLMRRPDQYPAMSGAVTHAFLRNTDAEPDEELSRESKQWSPAFRQVVKATAKAMDYIVVDYSWPMRIAFYLERAHDPDTTPLRMLTRTAEDREKENKTLSEIKLMQQVINSMAGSA